MRKSPEAQTEIIGGSEGSSTLLAAARAVLEVPDFAAAAAAFLGKCKSLLGAEAGFVALRDSNGGGFRMVLLDPGRLALDAGSGVPAPLSGLSESVAAGRTVFDNELSQGMKMEVVARGHSFPESALLAPILVAGEVAGLVGLIDKPGGFTAADGRLAEALTEIAALALASSRAVYGLERDERALEKRVSESTALLHQAEAQFQGLVESLPDVIARFDADLRHRYVSQAVEKATGKRPRDFIGRTNREMGMPAELVELWDSALTETFATGLPMRIEFAAASPDGIRHYDSRLIPERVDGRGVVSVLTIARDVTDRWLAHQAEREARVIAESLREATIALTRSRDRETVLTTLLERLRKLVPFDRASVMLLEEPTCVSVRAIFDGSRVVPLTPEGRSTFDPAEHPIVQSILANGTAVLIPDVRERPDWSLPTEGEPEASWMGVPLFSRGDVAGLFALSKREAGFFQPEHVKLAEAMSTQASVAVENAILFEQMQASTRRMQLLSRRLVEVQETERRRIARELHDEAGQALASLRYGLRLLEREIDEGGAVNARVAELMQRTDSVIESLHRLAADLRPASLDHLGLESALRQFARTAASEFGFTIHYKSRGFSSERLPSALETALYRVVQESITNVARHAKATRIDVLAEHRGDSVMVMIEDDGVGFEPERVEPGRHFGLVGLRERAEALGGTLTIESAPGKGTTIVVEVPVVNAHPDR